MSWGNIWNKHTKIFFVRYNALWWTRKARDTRYAYIDMYLYMFMCMCMYLYMHMYICVCICVCVCVCVCVYMYMYMGIYVCNYMYISLRWREGSFTQWHGQLSVRFDGNTNKTEKCTTLVTPSLEAARRSRQFLRKDRLVSFKKGATAASKSLPSVG